MRWLLCEKTRRCSALAVPWSFGWEVWGRQSLSHYNNTLFFFQSHKTHFGYTITIDPHIFYIHNAVGRFGVRQDPKAASFLHTPKHPNTPANQPTNQPTKTHTPHHLKPNPPTPHHTRQKQKNTPPLHTTTNPIPHQPQQSAIVAEKKMDRGLDFDLELSNPQTKEGACRLGDERFSLRRACCVVL